MAAPSNQPVRGILKNSSSFDRVEPQTSSTAAVHRTKHGKEMTWDEMNIIATYHPENKDYGHMKIDDPPTPYHPMEECDEPMDDSSSAGPSTTICIESVASRLQESATDEPCAFDGQAEEEAEEDDETEEQKAQRKMFEQRRKKHYNEFQAVKLARELMAQDDDEDDEDEQASQ